MTNPRADRVRAIRALSRRSVREREGRFVVEGPQGVREAVRHRPDAVLDVYADAARLRGPHASAAVQEIVETAYAAGLFVHEATTEVLAQMCDTGSPQGIVALCRPVDVALSEVLAGAPAGAETATEAGFLVVLAHVRDPGNAGTVIRVADATGARGVVLSAASVDLYNPKLVRSSAGSLFHLPIVRGLPISQVLDEFAASGRRLLAADGAGSTLLGDADLSVPHAWVLGNEAWGLTGDVRGACDEVVRVPIYGQAESLNLAMAATVALYESARWAARRGPVPGGAGSDSGPSWSGAAQ